MKLTEELDKMKKRKMKMKMRDVYMYICTRVSANAPDDRMTERTDKRTTPQDEESEKRKERKTSAHCKPIPYLGRRRGLEKERRKTIMEKQKTKNRKKQKRKEEERKVLIILLQRKTKVHLL